MAKAIAIANQNRLYCRHLSFCLKVFQARSPLGASIVVFSVLAVPQLASAATFTVNSFQDAEDASLSDGNCSTGRVVLGQPECTLRAAIQQIRSTTNQDQINLPAGKYVLTLGTLVIKSNLLLKGADPRNTIIDGSHADNVFVIRNTGTNPIVTMDSVTITNGQSTFGGTTSGQGGGIFNNSLQGNVSFSPSHRSTLILLNCIVTKNESELQGSGIANWGNLLIVKSTISDNKNLGLTSGGGVTATGGGIFHAGGGVLTIMQSTVSGNQATRGGGIAINFSAVSIENSTISGNRAFAGGGGIQNVAGRVFINFSTITNNVAGFGGGAPDEDPIRRTGGGILNEVGGLVKIGNTVLAVNWDNNHHFGLVGVPFSPDCFSTDASSIFQSAGGNLVFPPKDVNIHKNCNWVHDPSSPSTNFDRLGDPQFVPLADNGGPTQTHYLHSDSPAIDGALPQPGSFFSCPPTDQRGFSRSAVGRACDIGAVEVGAIP